MNVLNNTKKRARASVSKDGTKIIKRTLPNGIKKVKKIFLSGFTEERTYQTLLNKEYLVKYENSIGGYQENKFKIFGHEIKQIYFKSDKYYWRSKWEFQERVLVNTEYECESHSWKKKYIILLGHAYQISYFNTNGEFSNSKYKIFLDKVKKVYNENSGGEKWKKTFRVRGKEVLEIKKVSII